MARKPKRTACFNSREDWIADLKTKAITIEQGHFPSRAGGLTAYTLFAKASEGPITILVHGTGNDHLFTFQALIEALIEEGQTVLSFDLIGHGHESSTELSESDFWEAGEDLQKFLEYKDFHSRKLNGIGYSLGGLFLLNAIHSGQLRFDRLVLMAVPLRARLSPSFVWNEFLSLFSPTFHLQRKTYGLGETVPAFGAFRREDFPLRLPETYRKPYPQFVDELLLKRPPLTLLEKIGQNSLVLFGSRDKLAPPSDGPKWQEVNRDITLVTVDRANHFLLPFHKSAIQLIKQWIRS